MQPLGTEGQGIEGYPSKYSLKRFAWLKYGIGVRYALTDEISLGLEGIWTQTFFDYLDDVSSVYVDQQLLIENNGELAGRLSNRSENPNSTQRGNSENNDWFGFITFTVSYTFYPQ